MSADKPNCYQCIHRRDLPSDCHSRCAHPDAGGKDAGMEAFAILASVGRIGPMIDVTGAKALNIKANPHGVKNGWFNWPFNFDPTWLEACNGFTQREQK